MPGNEIDILAVNRGTVTAPAGCGKTQLIAEALSRHNGLKPILVLTHTNAGVVALRKRLNTAGVPPKTYRLSTIDGWAMRLISTFPLRSDLDPKVLDLRTPRNDYPSIRNFAATLLSQGHINDVIESSYAHLIVDEYQDCSSRQHVLLTWAAQVLPTCVLGDPMQSIFDFGGDGLANWENEVCTYFPIVGELDVPWRWVNSGADELGHWLLDVRRRLYEGHAVDLLEAPENVSWVELDGKHNYGRQLTAGKIKPPKGGSVLIIGDSTSPDSQRKFASQIPGAIAVEAVDLRDLVTFARRFTPDAEDAFEQLTGFAQSVMTGVGAAEFVKRVDSLLKGTARKAASGLELMAIEFVRDPSFDAAADLLVKINMEGGVRSYRPAVLRACIKALNLCNANPGIEFYEAVIQMREQYRLMGRTLPMRAVGSTLLLKGLEAEASVILNADEMNSKNLYVAMTRGSMALTMCSSSHILVPQG